MPVTTDLESRVKDAIAGHLRRVRPETLTAATRLREDLGADSLDLIELVFLLEQEVGEALPDVDPGQLQTLGDVVRHIQSVRG